MGIKHVARYARYALMLVDGRVFRMSKLDDKMRLKRIGEVENVVRPSCSDSHHAALTVFGEACIWDTNTFKESGRTCRRDVATRARLGAESHRHAEGRAGRTSRDVSRRSAS